MGQGASSTANTPMNSVPDERLGMPARFAAPPNVAVSPQQRGSAVAAAGATTTVVPSVPSVFKWHGGGETVYVAGDWDSYATKRALVRSESGHTLIVAVPAGQHRYRFEVDGRWMVDPEKPTTRTVAGDAFNVLTAERVGEFTTAAGGGGDGAGGGGVAVGRDAVATAASSPPGQYSQEVREAPPILDRTKRRGNPNEPPMLPPHLLRALLNTQSPSGNPLLLPLPHHVMLNHLYINKSREKDGIYIHGVTCRYRSKYVTTVLYKPI